MVSYRFLALKYQWKYCFPTCLGLFLPAPQKIKIISHTCSMKYSSPSSFNTGIACSLL